MSMGVRPRPLGGVLRLSPVLFALVLVLWTGTAPAADITVNCPASINIALGGLNKAGPNSVTITGTCVEAVVVDGFTNLALGGGAVIKRPAIYPDPYSAAPALQITGSEGVNINGLTFQEDTGSIAYSVPLVRASRSHVWMGNFTIQGSHSGGLSVEDHSDAWIEAATIQDNGDPTNQASGIGVSGFSHVSISMWLGGAGPSLIKGNGTGLSASSGATVEVGDVKLQDNAGSAVAASYGAVVTLGGWNPQAPTITGNAALPNFTAVDAAYGGEIWIVDPTAVVDNRGNGAGANLGGRLIVCCGPGITFSNNDGFGISTWMGGQVFFWGPALVQNNKKGGMALFSSQAFVLPNVVIRGNGDPSDPNSRGGVELVYNSTMQGGWTVADNYGPGVFIQTGSSALFDSISAITGNKGYGVQLEMNATATFADGTTVTGNKGYDLVCTTGSVAGVPKGQRPNIGKMKCPDWAQLTPPPAWATATAGATASPLTHRGKPR